jgi:hypothetical protein
MAANLELTGRSPAFLVAAKFSRLAWVGAVVAVSRGLGVAVGREV